MPRATERPPGSPSWRLCRLGELGRDARGGWVMLAACEAGPHAARLGPRFEALARLRADAYDAALAAALADVAAVREGLGRTHAAVLEARYVDGLTLREVAAELGVSVPAAARLAYSALDWLDARTAGARGT